MRMRLCQLLVAATAREISTVSIRMASRTCMPMMSLVGRDITASDVGPYVEFTFREMKM